MKRSNLCALTAILGLIAVIIGCATASRSYDGNEHVLKPPGSGSSDVSTTGVADLTAQSRQLVQDGKYRQALEAIDQILTLDSNNEYANGVRPLVEEQAPFLENRRYREAF